ncbi:MAG: hypothetical protein HYS26_01160 [Candidatus Kaiserbacteria bacterium]|nr:MAG: hypothetical protein HYS26_01160 [Candidatus Kaiserbacteria bacterium]
MSSRFATYAFLVFLALTLLVSFASFAYAQTDEELRSTVRAAILSDPRSASMSEAEIDAMVEALSGQAAEQGVTASDITWQPQQSEFPATSKGEPTSCAYPTLLCSLNEAFGLSGSSILLPTALGVVSALLLAVVAMMIEHHRKERFSAQRA